MGVLATAAGTGIQEECYLLSACPPRQNTLTVRKRCKTALFGLQKRPKRLVFFKLPRWHHATEDTKWALAKHCCTFETLGRLNH
jgi:hypothetical protein